MSKYRALSCVVVILLGTVGAAASSEADRLNDAVLRSLIEQSTAPVVAPGGIETKPTPAPSAGYVPQTRGIDGERGLLPPRPFERCAAPPCRRF